MLQHGDKRMNKDLMPDWKDDAIGYETNAKRIAEHEAAYGSAIDANSFEDIEDERLCQFCENFRETKNYLNQTVFYCAKNKVSVNSSTKCFNNKFKRAI